MLNLINEFSAKPHSNIQSLVLFTAIVQEVRMHL